MSFLFGGPLFSSIPEAVVTYPESGDLNEFSENTVSVSISTTTPSSEETGSAYEFTGSGDLSSTTGLNTYPQRDDRFSFHHHVRSGGDNIQIGFNAVDSDNAHHIRLSEVNNTFELRKRDSGSGNSLDSVSTTIATNTEHIVVVEWPTNDSVTVELYKGANSDPENDSPDETLSASITPFTDANGDVATGVSIRSFVGDQGLVFDYWIRERGL